MRHSHSWKKIYRGGFNNKSLKEIVALELYPCIIYVFDLLYDLKANQCVWQKWMFEILLFLLSHPT